MSSHALGSHALGQIGEWLTLFLILGVIAAALGAVLTRSLFGLVMALVAASALATAALLARDAANAGLALALLGAGVGPVLLLAGMLLSARTAKLRRGGRPWATIAAAALTGAAVMWATPELGAPAPSRVALAEPALAAPWLAVLIFTAGAACLALIGFGERGAFERRGERAAPRKPERDT